MENSAGAIKEAFAAATAAAKKTATLPAGFIADGEKMVNGGGMWMQGVYVRDGHRDAILRGRYGASRPPVLRGRKCSRYTVPATKCSRYTA